MQPEAAPGARFNVAVNQIEVVRPNLRNLSPEAGSSASTLVLFDGHRVTVDLTANALHFLILKMNGMISRQCVA